MSADIDKQLRALQKQIAEFTARIALPAYESTPKEQTEILCHFLGRTLQMIEASDLVSRARLGTPLVAFTRILCEDLFI
jgi:hypothetical protein